jgi:hypothetical protein
MTHTANVLALHLPPPLSAYMETQKVEAHGEVGMSCVV